MVLYCGQSSPEGTYTAQATQEDEAGNLGESTTVTFTVVTKAPGGDDQLGGGLYEEHDTDVDGWRGRAPGGRSERRM